MKKILLKFFTIEPDQSGGKDLEHALRVATAVLLVEVMRADFSVEPAERERLRQLLQTRFELDEAELGALLDEAEADADELVSLQHLTRMLNQHYDQAMKLRVIEMMWQLVYADGEKHHHEEHLLRRVADLLYVDHADFIQARHKAEAEAG